jgi:chromosome segregation ATPase
MEIYRIFRQPAVSKKEAPTSAKQDFQQKLEAQMKELDGKLDELKAKAQQATAEIRADTEKQLQVLSDKRAAAHAKLLELRQRTEDAWEDLNGGTEKAWGEMREALDHIVSRFQ